MAGSTFPFTDGSVITAAGQNAAIPLVLSIYSGDDLDLNTIEGSASHSITISSEDLDGRSFIEISIVASTTAHTEDANNEGQTYPRLRIQHKNVGGGYSDLLSTTIVLYLKIYGSNDHYNCGSRALQSLKFIHELTNDEKADGVVFNFTTSIEQYSMLDVASQWTTKQISFIGLYGIGN